MAVIFFSFPIFKVVVSRANSKASMHSYGLSLKQLHTVREDATGKVLPHWTATRRAVNERTGTDRASLRSDLSDPSLSAYKTWPR